MRKDDLKLHFIFIIYLFLSLMGIKHERVKTHSWPAEFKNISNS